MNKHIVTLIAIVTLTITSNAAAQTKAWFEVQATAAKADGKYQTKPAVSAWADKQIGSGFGVFSFASGARGFGQLYAGPTYSPIPSLQLGLGGGMESRGQLRLGSFAWFGGEPGYLLSIAEHDKVTGWWWRSIAALKPTSTLTVGGHVQRYVGVGPYFELKLDNSVIPITLWASPIAYDWENLKGSRVKAIAGLRTHF